MDDSVRRIPEPPPSTRDRLIAAVLSAVIVAVVLLLSWPRSASPRAEVPAAAGPRVGQAVAAAARPPA